MARGLDFEEVSNEQYVDKSYVASYLGMSVRTIEDLTSKRQLPTYKFGSSIRYRFGDIREWAQSRKL